MKPLILHVRDSNFLGGPEKQILGHIAASSKTNHSVLVFTQRGIPNEFFMRCQELGIHSVAVEARHSFDPSSLPRLFSTVRELRPDIVCTYGYKPAILFSVGKSFVKAPLVMHARGHTEENAKVRFFEALECRAMASSAHVVVSVSYGYARHLIACGVPRERIKVVHNAVTVDKSRIDSSSLNGKRTELGFAPGDQLIATAGRLSPEKAQLDLIRAFAKVSREFPRARLLILGDGPLRSKLERAAQEHCGGGVTFLGFRRNIGEIMASLDLFVLSSHTEGLPNVVLESFAHAKPVVATAVGGVPELVVDGITGLLVPPAQPDRLAEAISVCLRNSDKAQQMGQAGYQKVRSEFSFESQSRRLEAIYANVLRNGRDV